MITAIINALMFLWIISATGVLAFVFNDDMDELEDVFNPVAMYKHSELNMFGTIVISAI